jgi:hypothetical protein
MDRCGSKGPSQAQTVLASPSTLHVAQFQPVAKESGGLGSLHTINSALPTHRVDAAALSRAAGPKWLPEGLALSA